MSRHRDPVLVAPAGWTPPPERLTFLPPAPIRAADLGRARNVTLTVAVALERFAPSIPADQRDAIAANAGSFALDLFTTGAKS